MLRSLRVAVIAAAALSLASCAGFNKSVLEGGASLTATIDNPVTLQQQAEIEASYTVAAAGVLAYARLPRCSHAPAPCSSWAAVQRLKTGDAAVYKQLQNLRTFMDNNKTISAVTAFNAAQQALREFKATAFINNIKVD